MWVSNVIDVVVVVAIVELLTQQNVLDAQNVARGLWTTIRKSANCSPLSQEFRDGPVPLSYVKAPVSFLPKTPPVHPVIPKSHL